MAQYSINVRYRTASGVGTRVVTVHAGNLVEALNSASDLVRKRRGVVRIDGADGTEHPNPARYSRSAVQKAIDASNRSGRPIGPREAERIHALLRGRE